VSGSTEAKIGIGLKVAQYIFGLRAEQLLTLLVGGIFATFLVFAYWAVNTAIPGHLATVQAGYMELAEKYLDSKKEAEARHDEQFKRLEDRWDAAAKRTEETNNVLRDLVRQLILERRGAGLLPTPNGET
jgi:di/tricarboxylate transporter